MKRIAQLVSFLALSATAIMPVLYFYDRLALGQTQVCLLASALVWFVAAPLWMEHKAS